MHNSRDQRSPFEGNRFALREDSGTWKSDVDAPRIVRFASMNSIASDKDEPVITHKVQNGKTSLFLPSVLACILLAISLWLQLARVSSGGFASSFNGIRSFLIPTTADPTPDISPALRASIEDLVIATVKAELVQPVAHVPPALRAVIEELIISTVNAHYSRTRGLPDFALKANGGRIASRLTSGSHGFFGTRDDDPSMAIDDDVHAGRCWEQHILPFQLGVRLPHLIRPTHVSVEHLPTEMPVDKGNTPKNMTLWGVVDGKANQEIFGALSDVDASKRQDRGPPISQNLLWAPLVSFMYDVDLDKPVQTFPVQQQFSDSGMTFGLVVLEVSSNWGSDTTCLYRMRIHGAVANVS